MEVTFYVHGGFLAAWKEVQDIVINKITQLKSSVVHKEWISDNEYIEVPDYKFDKIITVGFSHGGALSGLCHECVWYNRPDIRENIFGYGFESPRFYRGLFVRKDLKERWANYTVIRNRNDIVTFLPPKLFLFSHVGKVLHLKPKDVSDYHTPKFIGAHYPDKVLRSLKEREEKL